MSRAAFQFQPPVAARKGPFATQSLQQQQQQQQQSFGFAGGKAMDASQVDTNVKPIAFDLDGTDDFPPLVFPASDYKETAYTYSKTQMTTTSTTTAAAGGAPPNIRTRVSDIPPYSPGDVSVMSVRSDATSTGGGGGGGAHTPTRERIFSKFTSTFDILGNTEKRLRAINDDLADVRERDRVATVHSEALSLEREAMRQNREAWDKVRAALRVTLGIEHLDNEMSQGDIEREIQHRLAAATTAADVHTAAMETELIALRRRLSERDREAADLRQRHEQTARNYQDLQHKLAAFDALSAEWEHKQQAHTDEVRSLMQENKEYAELSESYRAQAAECETAKADLRKQQAALQAQLDVALAKASRSATDTQTLLTKSEQSRKKLEEDVRELQTDKQALADELDRLVFAQNDADSQLQRLQDQCTAFQSEIQKLRDTARTERAEHSAAKQSLLDTINKLKDELEAKQHDVLDRDKDVDQSKRDVSKMQLQIKALERQVVDSRATVQRLEQELAEAQHTVEAQRQELQELQRQLRQPKQSPSKTQAEEQIAALTSAKTAAEEKLKDVMQQRDKQSTYLDEAIKRENDLKQKLTAAEHTRTDTDKRTLELQTRLTELKQIARRKEEELSAAKSLLERTVADNKELTSRFDRVYGEKEQLAVMRRDLEQQLQHARFELDRAMQSGNHKDKETQEYQTQMRVLQDDVSQLRISYQTAANSKARLETVKRELEQKIKALEQSNASVTELLEQARKDLEKTSSKLVGSEEKVLKQQKTQLANEERLADNQRQMTDVKAELDETRRKLETLTLSANTLRGDHRSATEQLKTLQTRYDAKQQELVDTDKRHKAAIDVHKTKLQEALTRVSELDRNLMDLRQQFLQVTEEKNRLVTECERLQNKLGRASQSKAHQEETLARTEESYANLKLKLQKREKELKTTKLDATKYRELYDSVTSSLTQVEKEKFTKSQYNEKLQEELMLAQVRVEDFATKTTRQEEAIAELKCKVGELEGDRDRYMKLYKKIEQEALHRQGTDQRDKQTANTQLAVLEHEKQKLAQQVKSLEAQIDTLKDELSAAREEVIQASVTNRMTAEQYEAQLARLKKEKGGIDQQVHLLKDEIASVPALQKAVAQLEITVDKYRNEKLTIGALISGTIRRLVTDDTADYIKHVRLVRQDEKNDRAVDLMSLMTTLTQLIGYYEVKRHELESKLASSDVAAAIEDSARRQSRAGSAGAARSRSPSPSARSVLKSGPGSAVMSQLKEQYTKIHADHQTFMHDIRDILDHVRHRRGIKLANDMQDLTSTGEIVEALDVIVQHLSNRGSDGSGEIERLNAMLEQKTAKIDALTESLEQTRAQLREMLLTQEHSETDKSLLETYNHSLRRELTEARKSVSGAASALDAGSVKTLKRQVLASLQRAQAVLDDCVEKGLMRAEHLEDVPDIATQISVLHEASASHTSAVQSVVSGVQILEAALSALHRRFAGKFKHVLETIASKKEKQVSALQIQLATVKETLQRYQEECERLRREDLDKTERLSRLSLLVERGEMLHMKAQKQHQQQRMPHHQQHKSHRPHRTSGLSDDEQTSYPITSSPKGSNRLDGTSPALSNLRASSNAGVRKTTKSRSRALAPADYSGSDA
ncbi:hypothetical protein RI367_001996 [Sorochytrium milnesiophthora]